MIKLIKRKAGKIKRRIRKAGSSLKKMLTGQYPK
jgi:hypothetical protein